MPNGYLDPQCWAAHDDDTSIYERLGGSTLAWKAWSKGPDSRVNQKQVVHDWLKVTNGTSRLRIMKRCKHLIRTLPALPLSETNHEDVNSDAEDHAYDALRGGLVKNILTKDERRRINSMRTRHRAKQSRLISKYGRW